MLKRLIAIPLAFVLASGAAWGYWTAGSLSGGNGLSSIASIDAPGTPRTLVSGHAVTVSWDGVKLNNGTAVTGYDVMRYSGSTKQTMTTACNVTVTATSCIEKYVPVGTWTYTIQPVYWLWKGAESSASTSFTIVNSAPVATADSYSTNEDTALTVAAPGVLSNDTDAESGTLMAELVTGVASGTLSFATNGSFTYTPQGNFSGTDSFTYRTSDGSLVSESVKVTLSVAAVNDAPVNRMPGTQETPQNTSKTFSTTNKNLVSISDIDSTSAKVTLTATNGTITLSGTSGLTGSTTSGSTTMTFTGTIVNINLALAGMSVAVGSASTAATATLKMVTSDLTSSGVVMDTDTDTVTINVNAYGVFTNKATIGAAVAGSSSNSSTSDYTVTGSGSDIWGTSDQFYFLYRALSTDGRLTARVVSQSEGSDAGAKAGVMVRQTTAANSAHASMKIEKTLGSEFTYRQQAGDNTGYTAANSNYLAPYYVRITRQGTTMTGERSYTGVAGTWVVEGSAVIAASNLIGLAVTSRNTSTSSTAVFSNVLLQTPPTTKEDAYSQNEDTTLTVSTSNGVLANDRDSEGNALTATLVTAPTAANFALSSDGSFTFTPVANDSGARTFTYTATNGAFTSAATTVTLNIRPANEAPSFTKGGDQSVLPSSGAKSISGWATNVTAGSAETQGMNFTTTSTNSSLFSVQPVVSPTGTLTYTPSGTSGSSTVTVNLVDNGGTANGGVATSSQTFTITVAADASGPTGGSVTAARTGTSSAYSPAAVSLTLTKGTDTPSGVAASGAKLLRAFGTLTSTNGTTADGVCSALGNYTQLGSDDPAASYTDTITTATGSGCYSYQYVVQDTVGNASTNTIALPVKVDLSAPSAPTRLAYSGLTNAYSNATGVVYYNPTLGGSFTTVASGATDAQSGIAGYNYPALGGSFGSSTSGTYAWPSSSSTTGPGAKTVTAKNNAFAASASGLSFTATPDSTAPTAAPTMYTSPAGSSSTTSISVYFASGSDDGSGIKSRQLKRATAPQTNGACGTYGDYTTITATTSPYTDASVTLGSCYRYQYVVTDNVGNVRTTLATTSDVRLHATYASTIQNSNSWDYFKLSEASGPNMVNNGRGSTGVYVGTPTFGVSGPVNPEDGARAVTFSGDDYATISYGYAGNYGLANFSLEFWFKSTDASAASCPTTSPYWWQGKGLVDAEISGSGEDFGVSFCHGNVLAGTGASGGYPDTTIKSSSTYTDDKWHQVAFTRASTGYYILYVDGAPVSGQQGGTANLNVPQITVGKINNAGGYFVGSMDELSSYDVVLTPSQVQTHYNYGRVDP
ncbi:tandem-95 repeat protein [Cryobacterium melibiosiphilum]|uniref:tandem-95 repeat protein n=1 Tax=Cryobacterium melibiosiphilum TaxID=995039 RepID=UPI001314E120|nr:tandem-95 repeat protein [Cryobacterium melibiosiphilum]